MCRRYFRRLPKYRSSNENRQSFVLRNLFKKYSSKHKTSTVRQQRFKNLPKENKKRRISGGDQVRISSTKDIGLESRNSSKHEYESNSKEDIHHNFNTLIKDSFVLIQFSRILHLVSSLLLLLLMVSILNLLMTSTRFENQYFRIYLKIKIRQRQWPNPFDGTSIINDMTIQK